MAKSVATKAKPKRTAKSKAVRQRPAWSTKIVGHSRVDPRTLVANPHNFRVHPQSQQAALSDAIDEVGFLRSVTVNKRTGRIVDGHARVKRAIETNQPTIDVEWVDLSPEEELKAIATLDPIGAMADVDKDVLQELMQEVETDSDALQAMLDELVAGEQAQAAAAEDELGELAPAPPRTPQRTPGNAIISYNLVFETPEQQQVWFDLLRALKAKSPGQTIAERLVAFILAATAKENKKSR